MRSERAKRIVADMDHYIHHDRIFLNNPAVMQGMGLAPLVVAATSGRYAFMLLTALAMLLVPTRVLCSLLYRKLEQPLLRALGYAGVSASLYILVRLAMTGLYGNDALELGIYLPLLVVDPLVIYRHGRVPEPVSKALSKGLRITLGYGFVLMLTGLLRELFAAGTLMDRKVLPVVALPLLSSTAGGFILVGVLFAVWRSGCALYEKYVRAEAKREE